MTTNQRLLAGGAVVAAAVGAYFLLRKPTPAKAGTIGIIVECDPYKPGTCRGGPAVGNSETYPPGGDGPITSPSQLPDDVTNAVDNVTSWF